MSDLDQAKGLIARGDKENAAGLLAAILLKNKDDFEAWLLLGDTIDEPSKKKVCYRQVLRLSPQNLQALKNLQALEEPIPADHPVTDSKNGPTGNKDPVKESRQTLGHVSHRSFYPPVNKPKEGSEIIWYVLGGLTAFLAILYVLASPDEASNPTNIIYLGLIFLTLLGGLIVMSINNRNRG